jgi:hypothetical protein
MATVEVCQFCHGTGYDECVGPCPHCYGGIDWRDDDEVCPDCGFMSCECDDYEHEVTP